MIANALFLVRQGLVEEPLHFNFVLGVPGALPASVRNLSFFGGLYSQKRDLDCIRYRPSRASLAAAAIGMGGHVRVGFEDNIYYRRGGIGHE